MLYTTHWKDYELIDSGNGERLERWGPYRLRRPDPQAIWPVTPGVDWHDVHAHYHRSSAGGGNWELRQVLSERWTVKYGSLSFFVRPTNFKHTGLFPEQAVNWDWLMEKIRTRTEKVRVLNLFAYTGGATVAMAGAGAEVCHLDAAKGMVTWAKENLVLSGLEERPVRFIIDDALKFVRREQRRGKRYEGIVMDPPSFGRGPEGEVWKIEDHLYGLIRECVEILAEEPLFFLINSYTTGLAPGVLRNLLDLTVRARFGGKTAADEVGLPVTASGLVLPCGACGRWARD